MNPQLQRGKWDMVEDLFCSLCGKAVLLRLYFKETDFFLYCWFLYTYFHLKLDNSLTFFVESLYSFQVL